MNRFPLSDAHGATAVEFALVAPIFLAVVVLILQASVALERWNAAQMVTGIAARCIAIAAPPCTAPATAPGTDPGIAYAIRLADTMGAGLVPPDQVRIEIRSHPDGIAYSMVSITVPITILGVTVPLHSTGAFPRR